MPSQRTRLCICEPRCLPVSVEPGERLPARGLQPGERRAQNCPGHRVPEPAHPCLRRGIGAGVPHHSATSRPQATRPRRLLSGEPLTKAEIRLSDGPSLQVVFRVPHGEAPLAALHARLAEAVAPLRSMVDEVQITENGTQLSVCLRVLFPFGAVDRYRGARADGRGGAADSRLRAARRTNFDNGTVSSRRRITSCSRSCRRRTAAWSRSTPSSRRMPTSSARLRIGCGCSWTASTTTRSAC